MFVPELRTVRRIRHPRVLSPPSPCRLTAAQAVTPDGRRAVSASHDNTLNVWELESGATIATFSCDAYAQCFAVANDCTIVAGIKAAASTKPSRSCSSSMIRAIRLRSAITTSRPSRPTFQQIRFADFRVREGANGVRRIGDAVDAAAGIALVGSSIATQVVAYRLHDNPSLGRPVAHLGLPVLRDLYEPLSWARWAWQFGNRSPACSIRRS